MANIPQDLQPHVLNEELEGARKQLPEKQVVSVLKLDGSPINIKESGMTAWRIPESNGATRGTMDVETDGEADLLACIMSLCVICGSSQTPEMQQHNPNTDRVILTLSGIVSVVEKEKDGEKKVVMENEIPWEYVESIHITKTQLYIMLFNRDALTNMWGQQDYISTHWAFPDPKAAAKLFVALRKRDWKLKHPESS